VERPEARAVVVDGKVTGLTVQRKNPARLLIENFMVTANMVLAQFLEAQQLPSIQRVVREPERWPRIRQIAGDHGAVLPENPDAPALSAFLRAEREAAPERFGDLSLAILKLLGRGEYVVVKGPQDSVGHFGLGMHNYAHSTAPNRRFPDLVTQRIIQAHLANAPAPYNVGELEHIAAHCSEREAAAQKVERLIRKITAAVLVGDRIGHIFDAVVTGASPKGVYVRAEHPAVEGRIVNGERGLDVGDKIRVRLLRVDVERGYIDFEHIQPR
jgi:exoribonuclease-2